MICSCCDCNYKVRNMRKCVDCGKVQCKNCMLEVLGKYMCFECQLDLVREYIRTFF